MKRAFVFDLNTFRFAATLKNEKGNDDPFSQKLLVEIINKCNTIIIPKGYINKYYSILSKLKYCEDSFDNDIFGLWRNCWSTRGKLDIKDDESPPLDEDGKYHDDDIDIVRLIADTNNRSVLVSTDNDLIKKLKELGMPRKYNFSILRPEQAIDLVGDV